LELVNHPESEARRLGREFEERASLQAWCLMAHLLRLMKWAKSQKVVRMSTWLTMKKMRVVNPLVRNCTLRRAFLYSLGSNR
jgi:hypothetical protein